MAHIHFVSVAKYHVMSVWDSRRAVPCSLIWHQKMTKLSSSTLTAETIKSAIAFMRISMRSALSYRRKYHSKPTCDGYVYYKQSSALSDSSNLEENTSCETRVQNIKPQFCVKNSSRVQ
jgi:hypothetical protein